MLPAVSIAAVIIAVVGAGLILWRRALASAINPNRAYPRRPREMPGTPPALVAAGAPDAQGNVRLVPARPTEPPIDDGWLGWRFLADPFVPRCCVCLGPHEREFATPLDTPSNVRVPLCTACHWSIVRRWWGHTLQCIAASVAVTGVIAWLIPGPDEVGRYMLWVLSGLIVSIAALATIPRFRVRPYALRAYDANRGVGEIRFENPQYTQLLAESIRIGPAEAAAASPAAVSVAEPLAR